MISDHDKGKHKNNGELGYDNSNSSNGNNGNVDVDVDISTPPKRTSEILWSALTKHHNNSQMSAIKNIADYVTGAESLRVALLQGPPGTGKTRFVYMFMCVCVYMCVLYIIYVYVYDWN